MKKTLFFLTLIILLSFFLRLYSAYGIPVSGDEAVSLLQSSGKAHLYPQFCQQHTDAIIPAAELLWFLEYSDDQGLPAVAESMEKAGMHPPLYYFFLHAVLKYFGNEPIVLRCISILFSLGSVMIVYLIGKELKDENLGLMAALLFAVSTYGIKFAFMIRPYPVVMFIALLSAWIVLRWSQKERFRFNDVHYWGVLILSIAGFYSIYHFIFHLVFLWSFLMLISFRRKRDFLVILSIPAVTGLVFSFWIPSLLNQMRAVKKGNYYFNGLSNPIAGIGQLLTRNFTKYLPFEITSSFFILAFLLVLGLAGLLLILRHKNGRIFVGSLVIYVLANTALDLILRTNTICVNKLAFFLSPASLLFLVAGCRFLKDRFQWKFSPYPVLFGLAAVHSFFALPYDISIDGPYDRNLLRELDREIPPSANKLVIINQPRRRYVFPFAQAMESLPNFVFASDMNSREKLGSIKNLKDFDFVTILYYGNEGDTVKIDQLENAQQLLESQGYSVKSKRTCSMRLIIVFEKADGNEQAQGRFGCSEIALRKIIDPKRPFQ